MPKQMKHPLINPNSQHYDSMSGKKSAIEEMEGKYTVLQMQSWAMITVDKYKHRLGKKDAIENELLKIATYGAYADFLLRFMDDKDMVVSQAYLKNNLDLVY